MAKTEKSKAKAVSAKIAKVIAKIRAPFMAYAKAFAPVAMKRAQLAPEFMKAYNAFRGEGGRTFVDFVREIDPTVPIIKDGKDGYKAHSSYAAADYLRRLESRSAGSTRGRAKPVRLSLAAVARLLATILPAFSNPDALWRGVAGQFDLDKEQIAKLKQVTAQSQPLAEIHSRPRALRIVNVDADAKAAA